MDKRQQAALTGYNTNTCDKSALNRVSAHGIQAVSTLHSAEVSKAL